MSLKDNKYISLKGLITGISSFVFIAGLTWTIALPHFENEVQKVIDADKEANKTNKLSHRLAEATDDPEITSENVDDKFGEMYKSLNGAVEDIQTFREQYIPLLEEESNREMRYIYKRKGDDRLWLHLETGEDQIRVRVASDGTYWYFDENNIWQEVWK